MKLLLLVHVLTFSSVFCVNEFKKDLSTTKIAFPPKIGKALPGSIVPVGHLRPLGWQRAPSKAVTKTDYLPDPEFFYKDYVNIHDPVVLKGSVREAPASNTWTNDDYMDEKYGDLKIQVVVKKEVLGRRKIRKMPLRNFLLEYEYKDWYLTTSTPQQMMPELTLPRMLRCGLRKYLIESELWMSGGSTASELHAHADHQLHCLLSGRKDFVLIDPKHKEKLDFVEKKSYHGAGYSQIDTDRVNLFLHKNVSSVPWTWASLNPGDCIYVPAKHLHQTRAYGRSISWTIEWAPMPDADFSDCNDSLVNKPSNLDDANLVWTYENGDRKLNDLHLDGDRLKHHLMLLLKDEDVLRLEMFEEFFEEILSEVQGHAPVGEVWTLMDPDNRGNITRQSLIDLDTATLTQVAAILNTSNEHLHDEL